MADLLLLIEILFHPCFTDLLLFTGVICVIAKVGHNGTLFNFNDLCYHSIEKIAVMGDDKHGTGIIQKISFQP